MNAMEVLERGSFGIRRVRAAFGVVAKRSRLDDALSAAATSTREAVEYERRFLLARLCALSEEHAAAGVAVATALAAYAERIGEATIQFGNIVARDLLRATSSRGVAYGSTLAEDLARAYDANFAPYMNVALSTLVASPAAMSANNTTALLIVRGHIVQSAILARLAAMDEIETYVRNLGSARRSLALSRAAVAAAIVAGAAAKWTYDALAPSAMLWLRAHELGVR